MTIKGKEIYYKDRKTKEVKLLPLDEKQQENLKKIGMNNMFDEGGEEQYNKATTEEELAEIIIKDCQKKGVKLIKREENVNN